MSPERGQYETSFEDVTKKAKEITLQDGQHVPLLIVEGSKSLIVSQIQAMPNTHGERLELMRLFGQATAMDGRIGRLEQVFFISEGWMSMASQNKPPEMRPSQDPARKEVLIVSALEINGYKKHLKIYEMIRNPDQEVVNLAELSPPQDNDGAIEVPLLDAFAKAFQLAYQAKVN